VVAMQNMANLNGESLPFCKQMLHKQYAKSATRIASVKVIQADKAAEHDNKNWYKICHYNGIQTQYASPTLQEDSSVAEQVRETIQDAGRAYMYTARLMTNEWLLAFSHANCYLQHNASSTSKQYNVPARIRYSSQTRPNHNETIRMYSLCIY